MEGAVLETGAASTDAVTTEISQVTPAATSKPKPTPRAKYTDGFVLACRQGKEPQSAPLLLLDALRALSIPHRMIDDVLGVPEETVKQFLLKGSSDTMTDATGMTVFFGLAYAKNFGVFEGRIVPSLGLLKMCYSYAQQADELETMRLGKV
jgi:hypothetical protein